MLPDLLVKHSTKLLLLLTACSIVLKALAQRSTRDELHSAA